MIDLQLLRNDPKKVFALLKKRDPHFDIERLYELDNKVCEIRLSVEDLRHKKNELAKVGKQGITPELREQSIAIGKKLKEEEITLHTLDKEFQDLYLRCPNIIMSDIPDGGKENNKVVKVHGQKPQFSFVPKHHVELGNALGWFDFEAASRMTGSNFALYKGEAVKLLYALTMYMLKHNEECGYAAVLPPYMVNEESLIVASNFPKFKDQVYAIQEEDLFMTPTAEVNLTNLYRDALLAEADLPIRLTAWTSCFRKEAGTYGASERGLIRIHQFEKVELYTLCKPETSQDEHEKMLATACKLLDALGLHYRVMLLAAQDCSFPSAKTYDIEVWMPGQGQYMEVSSVSNCTDFQARRGTIRYRPTGASKTVLVNTLNGSSLALSRLMVALMENYQQEDGSIALPTFLKSYGFY